VKSVYAEIEDLIRGQADRAAAQTMTRLSDALSDLEQEVVHKRLSPGEAIWRAWLAGFRANTEGEQG